MHRPVPGLDRDFLGTGPGPGLEAVLPHRDEADERARMNVHDAVTVGMTESAFNIRITHIDRTPNKTSHYIANIQTCLSILEKRGYGDLSAEVYKHL